MAKEKRKEVYRFDESRFTKVLKPSELSVGVEVWIQYNHMPWVPVFPHVVRKRIILKEHGFPYWSPNQGERRDETNEEYAAYREWLKDRIRNGEMYFKK